MTDTRHHYLAVLKASYDYEPQSGDEIAMSENQILFLLERTDDDWWKVKVKGDSPDDETASGLVPAAYVEPADHIGTVKVLYDYEAAAPGELNIKEDETLQSFTQEEEWLLVQTERDGGMAGYVPANYVETGDGETEVEASASRIIVPPSPPRPVSTYIDPAERVAASKATADDINTWSVSEVDQKGKKKKGTLGVGNGAVFFASESDKNPVQKWQTVDIEHISVEKSKHVHIAIGGSFATTLHFSTGSRDLAEAIVEKLRSSKDISTEAASQVESATELPSHEPTTVKAVHFSSSPAIIPPPDEDENDEEPPQSPSVGNHDAEGGEAAVALYDFAADGDDELTVTEGEHLTVLERDNDDWWKCRNSKGQEGVIPASYIELSNGDASAPAVAEEPEPEEEEDDSAAQEEERAKEEERQREKATRMEEEKRIQKEIADKQKKKEAENRAKAAAAAAEAERAERKRRKEATTARAQVQTPPISSRSSSDAKRQSTSSQQQSSSRTSTENGRPDPENTRVWHDRTGQFRVEAAFLGFNNGKLRLHKVNGVIVEVPSDRMSADDMRFVEKLTKKSRPPPAQRVSEDDVPLAVQHPKGQQNPTPVKKPAGRQVDWFAFFLDAGCDADDCTRYASSFERDKIDEALLPDITESTMRSLGLREGDIIRITKHIEKLHPKAKPEAAKASGPAPNHLFSQPGGALRTDAHRRGRPQPKNSLPTAVDMNTISSVSNIPRTSSPQVASPAGNAVQPPARSSSALAIGFEDDAWTNRPSSTQPPGTTASPAPTAPTRAPSAPLPAATTVAPTPPATVVSPPPVPQVATAYTNKLANTTEADILDQLARLTQLKPSPSPVQAPTPPVATPILTQPTGYQGPRMTSPPLPTFQGQSTGGFSPSPQQQPYNGPRGPFAPVPANQTLLQPLIPTQTGFSGFVPTRSSGAGSSPFQPASHSNNFPQGIMSNPTGLPFGNFSPPNGPTNNGFGLIATNPTGFNPSFNQGFSTLSSNPTGFTPNQNMSPLQSNPTGFNPTGFNPNFSGMVQSNPTGFNPGFGQSPFMNGGALSLPPVPPLPSSNNANPANIFAQMKSGTFATDDSRVPQPADKYDSLRANTVLPHPTGWLNHGPGGY